MVAIMIEGKIYQLNQQMGYWVTVSHYVEMFGLKGTNVVNNWVKRKIIPSDCVIDIPLLNVRIVKAIPYQPRLVGRPLKAARITQ